MPKIDENVNASRACETTPNIVSSLVVTSKGWQAKQSIKLFSAATWSKFVFLPTTPCIKRGFTRQSNAGDGYLQPANDGGNLQHQLVRSA